MRDFLNINGSRKELHKKLGELHLNLHSLHLSLRNYYYNSPSQKNQGIQKILRDLMHETKDNILLLEKQYGKDYFLVDLNQKGLTIPVINRNIDDWNMASFCFLSLQMLSTLEAELQIKNKNWKERKLERILDAFDTKHQAWKVKLSTLVESPFEAVSRNSSYYNVQFN